MATDQFELQSVDNSLVSNI